MTDEEYELEYRHALQELSLQGHEIVERRGQGGRLILIDGFPCSDWEIFKRAYDEQTAEMMVEERPRPLAQHVQAS